MSNACVICNGETYPLDDKQFNIIYHRCKSCGFIYEDPKYHVTFEKEKKTYEYHNNSLEDEGYVLMFNKFIDSFDSYVSGKTLLEFGSGPEPVLSELMRRRGYDITMYDRHYHDDKTYLEKSYDLITSTEVFEHFHDPMNEIKSLVSVLKENGILAIMTNFSKDDERFLKWWYRRDETHISFFCEETFNYIAKEFNLEIIYTNNKNYMIFKKR